MNSLRPGPDASANDGPSDLPRPYGTSVTEDPGSVPAGDPGSGCSLLKILSQSNLTAIANVNAC